MTLESNDSAPPPRSSSLPGLAISLNEASVIAAEVRRLISLGQEERALNLVRSLHPADMGMILAGLPRNSRNILLGVMSPDTVTWMLRQMNPVEAGRVATRLGLNTLAFLLRQVHPQQALATLRRLPLHRAQEVAETLETLETPLADEQLLEQTPDTAASLMIAGAPVVRDDAQVREARQAVAEIEVDRQKYTFAYVSDADGQLVAQIPMSELAIAADDADVSSIAAPIVAAVSPETDASECARLRRHYNLTQLPVVEGGRVIGAVLPDALLGALVEQDTQQMLQVANVAGEAADGPLVNSLRTRLPWLTINLATTFLAAATISAFESTLAQVVVLAAFLPVVAGQGGIGGTQTLTLIVRAIALGELVGVTAKRLLVREATLGVLHGIWLGILVAIIAIVWQGNLGLALVLGLAMLGNMIIAGTVGSAVPLVLRRLGVDPAVASAVVVTTFTDVFGFLLFLGIASAAISLIV